MAIKIIAYKRRSRPSTGWKRTDIERYAYGIEWDSNNPSPLCKRIGNLNFHRTLPIQNCMKGCIALGDKIMYYLGQNDWNVKADGSPSRLDGYDGEVKVEIPKFYLWSEVNDNIKRVYISFKKLVDYALEVPHMLLDAYFCTLLNRVPENMGYLSTLPVNSPISVVNTSDYCRGINNKDKTTDHYVDTEPFRSYLGKPIVGINRTAMRNYAKLIDKQILCYLYYKALYWLYMIEYANFNCLSNYNPNLTLYGYKLGGLGKTAYYSYWEISSYCKSPLLHYSGYANDLGNNSGAKRVIIDNYTNENRHIIELFDYGLSACTTVKISNTIFKITKISQTLVCWHYDSLNFGFNGNYKIIVDGLQDGQELSFRIGFNPKIVTITSEMNGKIIDVPLITDIRQGFRIYSNFTGECDITITEVETPPNAIKYINFINGTIPRYRGLECLWEYCFHNLDGGLIIVNEEGTLNNVYTTTNPEYFGDTADSAKNMKLTGNCAITSGYIKEFDLGNLAEIIPLTIGGSYTSYKCDYLWSNTSKTVRGIFLGGYGDYDAIAGLGCFYAHYGVGFANSHVGFRMVVLVK